MNWTIKVKLLGLTGVALLSLLAVGIAGKAAAGRAAAAAIREGRASHVLANHLEADAEHDVIRGDAYISVATTDKSVIKGAADELAEHAERLSAHLAENQRQLDGGAEQELLAVLVPGNQELVQRAQQVVALAPHDQAAARAQLAGVSDAFDKIDGQMDDLRARLRDEEAAARAQAAASAKATRWLLGFSLVAATALLVLAGLLVRSITRPLRRAVDGLETLATMDLTARIDVHSRDEIGHMAASLGRAVGELRASMQAIGRSAGVLHDSSNRLAGASAEVAGGAQTSASQAAAAAAGAERVNASIAVAMSGAEEMGASIAEIAENTGSAARVAAGAVELAEVTNQTIAKLGTSSAEVGEVVKVITSIAEQTNLLALNATIEAARAGEAGKGFAVVAGEVKELAKATATATEDIGRRIDAIQSDSHEAVDAIGRISEIIRQIADTQTTIAGAVEQQTATTREIQRSVAEAVDSTGHVVGSIGEAAASAQQTTQGAADAQAAVGELAQVATELQELVGRFRY